MASILSATRDDPLEDPLVDPVLDGGVAPTVDKDRFASVEQALTRLAHQGASNTPDAQPRGPASIGAADACMSQSFAAATLGPAELGPADLAAQIPHEHASPGKRSTLARVAIAVCLGACAIWAWRAYGDAARGMVATWAPALSAPSSAERTLAPLTPAPPAVETSAPPAQAASQAASMAQPTTTVANQPSTGSARGQQAETMARDLAALRQTVDRLAAGQEQLVHEIAKLRAEKPLADKPAEKRAPRHLSTPARGSDVFDPAQNPNAPGVPRNLGAIVVPR